MRRQQHMLQQTTANALANLHVNEVIEIKDVQRLQELDVNDRYNVLEYLVKELIGIKKAQISESISDSHHTHQSKKKKKTHVEVEDVDRKSKHRGGDDVESISVDSEAEQLVQSSNKKPHHPAMKKPQEPTVYREEWEEDLTSTQNLGLSNSGGKSKK